MNKKYMNKKFKKILKTNSDSNNYLVSDFFGFCFSAVGRGRDLYPIVEFQNDYVL